MRLKLIINLLLLNAVNAFGADSTRLSLAESIEFAKENSLQFRAHKMELQKANYRIKEITGTGLPQINGSFDFRQQLDLPVFVFPDPATGEQTPIQVGTKFQSVAGISVSQLIFDGSYFLGLRAAKEYKSLTEKLVEKETKDLEANIAKAYFLALISKENQKLIDENLKTLSETLKETQALFKEGFVELLDVERLKLSVSNLEVQKAKVADAVFASESLLKSYLGMDIDAPLVLTDNLEDHYKKATQSNVMSQSGSEKNRPEVKVLEQQMEMNRLDMERYKVMRYPTIRGFYNFQEQFFGDQLTFDPWFRTSLWGIAVNVPIFSSGVNKNQIRQARLTFEQDQLNFQHNLNQLKMQRLTSERDFNTSVIRVNQQTENFELAKKINLTTLIKYQEGVGSNIEVINANQELKTAQANYLDAIYEVLVNKINLQIASGQPLTF